jgi:hypothetical protein
VKLQREVPFAALKIPPGCEESSPKTTSGQTFKSNTSKPKPRQGAVLEPGIIENTGGACLVMVEMMDVRGQVGPGRAKLSFKDERPDFRSL